MGAFLIFYLPNPIVYWNSLIMRLKSEKPPIYCSGTIKNELNASAPSKSWNHFRQLSKLAIFHTFSPDENFQPIFAQCGPQSPRGRYALRVSQKNQKLKIQKVTPPEILGMVKWFPKSPKKWKSKHAKGLPNSDLCVWSDFA